MKKNIFVMFFLFLSLGLRVSEAKRQGSSKDFKNAVKMIEENGLNIRDVDLDKKSPVWQVDCSSDMSDEPNQEKAFLFEVIVNRTLKFKDLTLKKGDYISFCNGKPKMITTQGPQQRVLEKDGYSCFQTVYLNRDGQLCGCELSKDTEINGFLVPKGTEITLKKGKLFSALLLPSNDKRLSGFESGYYGIKDGKPTKLNKDSIWCTAEGDF